MNRRRVIPAPPPHTEARARHNRRTARFEREFARAARRSDRIGVAVDYLRGAVHDAPAGEADRAIAALVELAVREVARLHRAELERLS
jgi:hypothetical protein